jgi:hypothetical protein
LTKNPEDELSIYSELEDAYASLTINTVMRASTKQEEGV